MIDISVNKSQSTPELKSFPDIRRRFADNVAIYGNPYNKYNKYLRKFVCLIFMFIFTTHSFLIESQFSEMMCLFLLLTFILLLPQPFGMLM